MHVHGIIVLFVFGCVCSQVIGEDLLELHCLGDEDCKQYDDLDIQSTCNEYKCHCSSSTTNETVTCKPKASKLTNIIGGACPCTQPNSECNSQYDVCYCTKEFIPSMDLRRCIKKYANLGESCEMNTQCWNQDNNYAECNINERICTCLEGFIEHAQMCFSVVGNNKTRCKDDMECEKYGASAVCIADKKTCVCSEGFVSSMDKQSCISISKYNESCTENTQCQGSLGSGGECIDSMCTCSGNYFPYETKMHSGEMKMVCARLVEIGQYCRDSTDCYQHQFSPDEQTMDCYVNECNCRLGYNSLNDANCVRASHGVTAAVQSIILPFSIITLLLVF